CPSFSVSSLLVSVRVHLHSFPTRRSSDLGGSMSFRFYALIALLAAVLGCRIRGSKKDDTYRPTLHYFLKTKTGGASGTALPLMRDRKSTRLNSSHGSTSYAVFCLKKITNC